MYYKTFFVVATEGYVQCGDMHCMDDSTKQGKIRTLRFFFCSIVKNKFLKLYFSKLVCSTIKGNNSKEILRD